MCAKGCDHEFVTISALDPNGNGYQISLEVAIKYSFKDIIKLFKTNGSMNESLLNLLTVSSTSELRESQPNGHILRQAGKVSDDVVLAMVAIKILTQYFAKDSKLWSLVGKKARKFVMASTGMEKNALQEAIQNIESNF